MKTIWNRIMTEPALIFTGFVTGYTAAIAAGWMPAQWVTIAAAILIALGGVFGVRANVSPTSKLPSS